MKATVLGIEFVMCDAYIDQKHRIGNTPIGYKCTCLATTKVGDKDLCNNCAILLENAPERVTFGFQEDRT